MTVRNTKRLILALIGLLVLLSAVEVTLAVVRPQARPDYFEMLMPLFLAVTFAGTWQRLSKLEAEHGPDYIQPSPPYARKVLIGVAILAAVLAGVLGFLIARR